jgi:hypothetical protein
MKATKARLLVLIALGVLGSGCGSAVLIAHSEDGGVFGLEGDRTEAMADARRQMSESCGGAYTIIGVRRVSAGAYRGRALSEVQLRYLCGMHPEQQMEPTAEP